jgi:large subunit ribosomal protein L19e
MRLLISDGHVSAAPLIGSSRVRARKTSAQKRKGLRRGAGSRKGKSSPTKESWMIKVRAQRLFLKELKEKEHIAQDTYRSLYMKSKGGFFRSRRHIKLFIDDKRLWTKKSAE